MSTSLVAYLTKAGFAAQRLLLVSASPASGLWIHGIFTELNEGNQITRAVIGFGQGGVKMSLYVTVTNLAHAEQPLYSSADNGRSGKAPGGVITMSPIGAAVKFVMEKNATEKTIKKTAGQIAKEMAKRVAAAEKQPVAANP
ncbi:MAG: DUF4410 domain-containing protein [Bryobacteraceae bacterium]